MSADEVREQGRAFWAENAKHWGEAADAMDEFAASVSAWLVEAAGVAPGHRVLDLACGAGETGLRAARAAAPGGEVLLTDVVEEMLAVARERARAAGVDNVGFKLVDAEWIDEPTASFDAIVCRWGLMFPLDLEAAFRECRRVLRPDGRLALAAWAAPEENPWATAVQRELLEQGLAEPPPEGDLPGPFRLADPERLRGLLEGAGFAEIAVEPLARAAVYRDFEAFWALHSNLSSGLRRGLEITNERGAAALREGIAARLAPYRREDGSYAVPNTPLLAAATS